jgi:PilZ domain
MNDSKTSPAAGTDWTQLLSDPDMVRHVGKLLQVYREASPEQRNDALLTAMREIKAEASATTKPSTTKAPAKTQESISVPPPPVPTAAADAPPFEPDIFSPGGWGEDRRRHPRIKCFVAVELRVDYQEAPVWGNLSNTSIGGCLVETATPIKSGTNVEIGLWLANGKIWIKGFALSGIVTRTGPSTALRVRFGGLETKERENLRQFLKFVQESARASRSESNYMQLLK